MPTTVKIIVDVHEDDSGIDKSLKLLEMPIEVRSLVTGDVVLNYGGYTVGIEIKRFNDFQNSLYSGRLHDQMCRLTDQYDYPILIVQGFEGTDLDWFYKAINTLNLRMATYVTDGNLSTVELIGEFVRLLTENKFNILRRPIMLEPDVEPEVKVLCAFPYVSKVMAIEILEKYGTLADALQHIDEWSEIKRLTDKRVAEIKDALKREWR